MRRKRAVRTLEQTGLRWLIPDGEAWRLDDSSDPRHVLGKYCLVCKQWLPQTSFYVDRAKIDGIGSYCKPCMVATRG